MPRVFHARKLHMQRVCSACSVQHRPYLCCTRQGYGRKMRRFIIIVVIVSDSNHWAIWFISSLHSFTQLHLHSTGEMATPFQLAFALHGHSADVRNLAVATAPSPLLASTSRDGSAIVWGPSASGKEWTAKLRVEELEKRIVSCAAFVKHMDQCKSNHSNEMNYRLNNDSASGYWLLFRHALVIHSPQD